MSAFESFTPAMYDALRAIGGGAVTAKDIGIHGNTLSALCDRGFLKAEHASCRTYYEPTQLGLGAIAMLKAPFVPKRIDGPVATIQKAVAEYYGLNPVEMVSDRRARSVARPRQIAMYLARELTTYSYPMIGKLFGNRDHTTVLHAVRLIAHLDENDAEISHDINVLLSELEDLRS